MKIAVFSSASSDKFLISGASISVENKKIKYRSGRRLRLKQTKQKILIICDVLGVTPYELLGGTDGEGTRSNPSEVIIVAKNSEYGELFCEILTMDNRFRERMIGYMKALQDLQRSEKGDT